MPAARVSPYLVVSFYFYTAFALESRKCAWSGQRLAPAIS
jgi:hypothetical protein